MGRCRRSITTTGHKLHVLPPRFDVLSPRLLRIATGLDLIDRFRAVPYAQVAWSTGLRRGAPHVINHPPLSPALPLQLGPGPSSVQTQLSPCLTCDCRSVSRVPSPPRSRQRPGPGARLFGGQTVPGRLRHVHHDSTHPNHDRDTRSRGRMNRGRMNRGRMNRCRMNRGRTNCGRNHGRARNTPTVVAPL